MVSKRILDIYEYHLRVEAGVSGNGKSFEWSAQFLSRNQGLARSFAPRSTRQTPTAPRRLRGGWSLKSRVFGLDISENFVS